MSGWWSLWEAAAGRPIRCGSQEKKIPFLEKGTGFKEAHETMHGQP